jgi:alcohol dehydrogenase (cytochrome c)
MRPRGIIIGGVLVVGVAAIVLAILGWSLVVAVAGYLLNSVRSASNSTGTFITESNPSAPQNNEAVDVPDSGNDANNWPSYNRSLTSNRFSSLRDINVKTVRDLKVLCRYDTGLRESFETGPIVVDGALIGTTAKDIFSIDPSSCRERWRVHDDLAANGLILSVNRGAAYLDGRVFRGTLDGRVVAYEANTGKRLWETRIAESARGDIVDSAPIAWNGLVFIGVAMGDVKGVKGRMYALTASTGSIVWETYLVPREPNDPVRGPEGEMPLAASSTWGNASDVPINGGGTWTSYSLDPETGRLFVPVGNPAPDFVESLRGGTNLFTNSVVELDALAGSYANHYQIATHDWHDWDVSNAPALITTRSNRHLMAFTPKNGDLYVVDRSNFQLVYRVPVTRIEHREVAFAPDTSVHFCPGAFGGGEWNGVAYDPQFNLILSGETDWCTTVRMQPAAEVRAVPGGQPWMGNVKLNPLDVFGAQDPHSQWAGWLYATDADTGTWKWRIKTNYPILGAVTATAGGIVFFGDMGGNFYAVDARNGARLWGLQLHGAVSGGVISFATAGKQFVGVTTGLTSVLWPTEQTTAQIVILGR